MLGVRAVRGEVEHAPDGAGQWLVSTLGDFGASASRCRMRDVILPLDHCAVPKLRPEGQALIRAHHREHNGALGDARYAAEQEDGRLERVEKGACPREEEVAHRTV